MKSVAVEMCLLAERVARDVSKRTPDFSMVQKFQRDFLPSDMPSVTPSMIAVTDTQSVTDESVDRLQSECYQPLSGYTSEVEGSDVGGDSVFRRKPTKLKSDSIPGSSSIGDW